MIATILFDILAPILVLVAIGAWSQWKFKLDLPTLSKLNIYLFVPAFVFNHVAGSSLPLGQDGRHRLRLPRPGRHPRPRRLDHLQS